MPRARDQPRTLLCRLRSVSLNFGTKVRRTIHTVSGHWVQGQKSQFCNLNNQEIMVNQISLSKLFLVFESLNYVVRLPGSVEVAPFSLPKKEERESCCEDYVSTSTLCNNPFQCREWVSCGIKLREFAVRIRVLVKACVVIYVNQSLTQRIDNNLLYIITI